MADIRIQPIESRMPPCKVDGVDCPLRCVGCHSTCKEFRIYRKSIEAGAKSRAKAKIGYSYYMASRTEHLDQVAKDKKHKNQYRGLCGGKRK